MALSKTIELVDNFGETVSFPDAYIRVENAGYSKKGSIASVSFYKSINSESALTTMNVDFPANIDKPNLLKQAYEHLKTLSEFSGAKDC